MKKRSILLINRVYPPAFGATGQMAYDLAQHLVRQGHTVTVLTAADKNSIQAKSNMIVKSVKRPKNHKSFLGLFSLWMRLCVASFKLKKHDVIITMTDPPMLVLLGYIYQCIKKSYHIHWVHDVYPDLFPELGVRVPGIIQNCLKKLSSKSMNASHGLVAVSQCMRRHLSKMILRHDNITVVPNWPPAEVLGFKGSRRIEQDIKQPNQVRRNDDPKFRVLYAGHIGRAHVVNPILEAAEKLKECVEIEFMFVCQESMHEKLARERDKRGLENIKLVPLQPTDNITPVIESGDLHIVTMRKNVQGMLLPSKFYSSLAVARPVLFVGPNKNDIVDTIDKYQMGSAVFPHQVEKLAQIIYDYRMDGDLWLRAQQGALNASEVLNFQNSMAMWDNLLERLG